MVCRDSSWSRFRCYTTPPPQSHHPPWDQLWNYNHTLFSTYNPSKLCVCVMLFAAVTLFSYLLLSVYISLHQKPTSTSCSLHPHFPLCIFFCLSSVTSGEGQQYLFSIAVFIALRSWWPTHCKVWHCSKGRRCCVRSASDCEEKANRPPCVSRQ